MNKTRASRYTYVPVISFERAQESYFFHEKVRYDVVDCPSDIFKEKVRKVYPYNFIDPRTEDLLKGELGLVDRWYLLNELKRLKHPIKLFQD